MKKSILLSAVIIGSLLLGCAQRVRSISQIQATGGYVGMPTRELDEFEVLGLERDKPVTEEEIQRAARQAKPVQLTSGSTILLIQSGAVYPDGPMVSELTKQFRIVPFTGVATETKPKPATPLAHNQTTRNVAVITDPDKPVTVVPLSVIGRERYPTATPPEDPAAYSRTLRLAAARAGASTVVCYWGILESGNEKFATKTVSWLPIVNWVVPDERQHMRIRLKIAMVDVATGSWSMFSGEPLESKAWSISPRREVVDQKQIESIKKKAYELAAQGLVKAYAKPL